MAVIELQNLTKFFGKSRGVTDITLSVEEGMVVGFLGPNGAGKSTTMNMLIGYIEPTSGQAKIFGKDVTKEGVSIRNDIGFLSSDMVLDGNLTGWQQIEYFSRLRDKYDKQYVIDLAKRLDANLNRKIQTLSRGNRQKVALIATLVHRPKLLLLDEPTSGLDPLIQSEFNKIILETKAAGQTVFISSHVLSEVEELCDRMIFIRDGKLIANKTMDDLAKTAPKYVRVTGVDTSLIEAISGLEGVAEFKHANGVLQCTFAGTPTKLIEVLADHNFDDIVIAESDLETSFMEYYGEEK